MKADGRYDNNDVDDGGSSTGQHGAIGITFEGDKYQSSCVEVGHGGYSHEGVDDGASAPCAIRHGADGLAEEHACQATTVSSS